jgi:hypothetical protein
LLRAHDLVGHALRLGLHLGLLAAEEALGGVHGVFGVGDGLATRHLPDENLTLVIPGDHGGRQPGALGVDDHFHVLALHHGDDAVGGAEVDTDNLAHEGILLVCNEICADCWHPSAGVNLCG